MKRLRDEAHGADPATARLGRIFASQERLETSEVEARRVWTAIANRRARRGAAWSLRPAWVVALVALILATAAAAATVGRPWIKRRLAPETSARSSAGVPAARGIEAPPPQAPNVPPSPPATLEAMPPPTAPRPSVKSPDRRAAQRSPMLAPALSPRSVDGPTNELDDPEPPPARPRPLANEAPILR